MSYQQPDWSPAGRETPPADPFVALVPPGGALPKPTPPRPPQRRLWDIVLTVVLLGIGLLSVIVMFVAAILAFTAGFNTEIGVTTGSIIVGVLMIVLGIVSMVVASWISIRRLLKNKLAFSVPLIVGAIAQLLFFALMVTGVTL